MSLFRGVRVAATSLAIACLSVFIPHAPAQTVAPSATTGDAQAGLRYFMDEGKCASCHAVQGRGGVVGPDLATIGRDRTPAQLQQALLEPGTLPPTRGRGPAYPAATVKLRDGHTLHGVLRNETPYDLQLQGTDGKLYLLTRDQYSEVTHETQSIMPKLQATQEQARDLLRYLTTLNGDAASPALLPPLDLAPGIPFADIVQPKPGEWPTYNGNVSGNRFSPLTQIDTGNAAQLSPMWTFELPGTHRAMENTPVVADGIMYVTGSNECFALDARTGRQIWHYQRPRTKDINSVSDAATGINRGVALLGDRVFMITDNAHLIALQRLTGALVWDTEMADYQQNYTATGAPLVVGDMVIMGVSGGDEGIRGFVSAYKASTGERVWRFWTVPAPGEPGSETWVGTSINHPGSSTWMTGTYDPQANILYWGVGNPGPDHNGDQRIGDNLYSCSILALNPQTGKLIWYRQLTPHNLHDWDATQTPMLVDAAFHGKPRKLLVQANRNGFFYVMDRLTGELLLAEPFIHNMSWATSVDLKTGRPILKGDSTPTYEGVKVCPNTSGATNWPSASYDPQTGQFLVFASELCAIFIKRDDTFQLGKGFTGGTTRRPPGEVGEKILRALDLQTGKISWEIPNVGGSIEASGLIATAGGILFYGDGNGQLVVADARTGKLLWSFYTSQNIRGGPITYTIDGKQRLAIVAGQTVMSFGLR